MNRFRKDTKCSALLMFPGIASLSRSSGRTASICQFHLSMSCFRKALLAWVCHECILLPCLIGLSKPLH